MKNSTLFIFSGLPGSGKTTLATKLASYLPATYLRIDTIEVGLRGEEAVPDLGRRCYHVAHAIAKENLALGNSVVADSVNPWNLTRETWNEIASSLGAPFVNIQVVCSDSTEHQRRLETRTTTLDGLVEPSWQEVLEREYHPWSHDRIFIETKGKTISESFEELLLNLKDFL